MLGSTIRSGILNTYVCVWRSRVCVIGAGLILLVVNSLQLVVLVLSYGGFKLISVVIQKIRNANIWRLKKTLTADLAMLYTLVSTKLPLASSHLPMSASCCKRKLLSYAHVHNAYMMLGALVGAQPMWNL